MLIRIPIFLLLFFCASETFAQSNAVSLTSGGFPMVSGESPGTPVSTQSTAGEPLSANLDFGNVSPSASGARRVIIKTPIRIAAKKNYKVEIKRTNNLIDGVHPSDIGFGVSNARLQSPGDAKNTDNATTIVIAGYFSSNPSQAPIRNGIPQFQATLADIGEAPTLLFTGVPTTKGKGHVESDDGSILIDFIFAVDAQYYKGNALSNLNLIITEYK